MRSPAAIAGPVASLLSVIAAAAAAEELAPPSALAEAFGASPSFSAELSPDGTQVSMIHAEPDGSTFLHVVDAATGTTRIVLNSDERSQELRWCRWANDSRILCATELRAQPFGAASSASLVGVDADGRNLALLYRNQFGAGRVHDRVVDWLPDDREHVLVEVATPASRGMTVLRLNVYTGTHEVVETAADARELSLGAAIWITDNRGAVRVRVGRNRDALEVYARDTPAADWDLLHTEPFGMDVRRFAPIGFGENRDELLYLSASDGRIALFGLDLAHGRARRTIFRDRYSDVAGVVKLGKHSRAVAALYRDHRGRFQVFDARVADVQAAAARLLPDREILVIGESWDRRFYLLLVRDETTAGRYYRFDAAAEGDAGALVDIAPAFPSLGDRRLAPTRALPIHDARGIDAHAYLTVPADAAGALPTVVLAVGGPALFERSYLEYDYVAQYLTARGYAVLQIDRGTELFEWFSNGGFRDWPEAVASAAAAAEQLVAAGVAAPGRICVAGYHYAGHTALMSAIERADLYRCAVSIGGIPSPLTMTRVWAPDRNERLIGDDGLVRDRGSPAERIDELTMPVLIVHAELDDEAPASVARDFAKRLARRNDAVTYVAYDDTTGDFRPRRNRMDMLDRLGEFLDAALLDGSAARQAASEP